MLEHLLQLLPIASAHPGEKETLPKILQHSIFDETPIIHILGLDITKHIIIIWIIGILLTALVLWVARAVRKDESAIGGRVSILVQIFIEFIHDDVVKPNFHGESKKWLPFFLTLFFFIMFANLFGLFPGSATITGNIAVTLTLALVTFFVTQIFGMIKKGFLGYWTHLVPAGVPKALWPLMMVIEFVGLFTKPFALTIRLFANMIAGHIVIIVLLFLTTKVADEWFLGVIAPLTIGGAVAVNILEIFIALLQAYIFAFLSAIFIAEAGAEH